MPATSRSGDALRAALGQRPRRLALEVEDDDVAFGDEHLAEVVVAVAADALAAALRAPSSVVELVQQLDSDARAPRAPGRRRRSSSGGSARLEQAQLLVGVLAHRRGHRRPASAAA